jgi:hypothetical protein
MMVSLALQYRYSDFTHKNYRELLRLAARRFEFRGFENFRDASDFIIWRHDVDASMHAARNLAHIEAEEGVRATYFLSINNPLYNLFEADVAACVKEIVSLGHDIGVHFDISAYPCESLADLERALLLERNMLQGFFQADVRAFSFHNPDARAFGFEEDSYAGMANAYARSTRESVSYCSDSNGYWRYRPLDEVLRDRDIQKLQVLTHPEWWTEDEMSPRERITYCIEGRARAAHKRYDEMLRRYGRENVGA